MIEISYKLARLEYDRNIRQKGSNIARKEREVERKVVRKSTLKGVKKGAAKVVQKANEKSCKKIQEVRSKL